MIENCCRGMVKDIFRKVVIELRGREWRRGGREAKRTGTAREEEAETVGLRFTRFGCLAPSCPFPCCLHILDYLHTYSTYSYYLVFFLTCVSINFEIVLQTTRQDILCGVYHQQDLIVVCDTLCNLYVVPIFINCEISPICIVFSFEVINMYT